MGFRGIKKYNKTVLKWKVKPESMGPKIIHDFTLLVFLFLEDLELVSFILVRVLLDVSIKT